MSEPSEEDRKAAQAFCRDLGVEGWHPEFALFRAQARVEAIDACYRAANDEIGHYATPGDQRILAAIRPEGEGMSPEEYEASRVFLAREIVGRAFSTKEAQDLPLDDLMEIAMLLSEETMALDRIAR